MLSHFVSHLLVLLLFENHYLLLCNQVYLLGFLLSVNDKYFLQLLYLELLVLCCFLHNNVLCNISLFLLYNKLLLYYFLHLLLLLEEYLLLFLVDILLSLYLHILLFLFQIWYLYMFLHLLLHHHSNILLYSLNLLLVCSLLLLHLSFHQY